MENVQPQSNERADAIARKIVDLATASLFVDMPFLDVALFRLKFAPDAARRIPSWATDGREVFYNASYVLGRYRELSSTVAHDILHTTLHCVFRHMFVHPDIDQQLWDIACDIAVESVIASLDMKSLEDGRAAMRDAYLGVIIDLPDILTAEKLYRTLVDAELSEEDADALEEAFSVDVHPWYLVNNRGDAPGADQRDRDPNDTEPESNSSPDPQSDDESSDEDDPGDGPGQSETREKLEQEWEDAAKSVQTGLETIHGRSERGTHTGELLQALQQVNRKHYDYKRFLQTLCTWGEQIQVNDDEFDYIYYSFGLDTYTDMPLIEPLEYKDVKRLRDIAIVLDTSASVHGDMMQRLFERSFDLIMGENNAFKRFRIHLIQCDAEVKDDIVLHSREDLEDALAHLEFKGLGGTDFAPAFEYVDSLVAQGAFVNFKGLIYFTDGRGAFPASSPAYKAAFVFMEDDYEDIEVPCWAFKLVLTEDEVRRL